MTPTNDPTLTALLQARDRRQEEESVDIEQYRRGSALRGVVNTEAWEILCDTLEAYATKANDDLLGLAPGDPNVTTAHAAASALRQVVNVFKEDIESAVQKSYEVPEAIRRMQ